jgi:hypothetical protein
VSEATDKPDGAKESKSRILAYRPIELVAQLIAIGVAAGLWLSGLVSGYLAIVIAMIPAAVIHNYEWLHPVLHPTPQKRLRTKTDRAHNPPLE